MPTELTEQQQVKRRVLSMWQPFASLLAAGIKTVESRGKNTDFRGEFLIHATGSIPGKVYKEYYLADEEFRLYVHIFLQREEKKPLTQRDFNRAFVLGAIIGSAELTESLPSWDLKERWGPMRLVDWEREFTLGDHSSNRYAWVCENPKQFKTCTPIKGFQTLFWSLDDTIVIHS